MTTIGNKVKTKTTKSVKREVKVARGTERSRRRAGLVRNWRNVKGAKPMLPTKEQEAQEVAALAAA